MLNNFKLQFISYKGLSSLSPLQASIEFLKFNVYFRLYVPDVAFNVQDNSVYKLDGLKDFDKQYSQIKTINFPYYSSIYFYTDYSINEDLIYHNARISLQHLKNSNQNLTLTNLKKVSKIKDIAILKDVLFQDKSYLQGVFHFD